MADYSVLSSRDKAQLQEMLSWYHRVVQNARNRPDVRTEESNAPEVYVCKATTGIPAFQDPGPGTDPNEPGQAECTIWRLLRKDGPGTADLTDLVDLGFTQPVFNLSATAVPAGTVGLAVRDKFGSFIFLPVSVGSSSGTRRLTLIDTNTPFSQSIATGGWIEVNFDAPNVDDFGGWNTGNNRFEMWRVATQESWHVEAQVTWDLTTVANVGLEVATYDYDTSAVVTIGRVVQPACSGAQTPQRVSAQFPPGMDSGDGMTSGHAIIIRAYQDSGVALNIVSSNALQRVSFTSAREL